MTVAPRVSILLPVRDAEATLGPCLRSVQRQTEGRFECVIVDDGSADASLAIARRFAASDPRLRVVAAPRAGLVPALDRGLALCRGRFVARMDADDLMHRDRLGLQAEALAASPGLCAVGSHVRLFPRRSLGAGMRAYEAWLASIDSPRRVREESFVECPVSHPTLMFRSDAIARFGYRDAGWPEDYDLLLRMLAAGEEISVLPRRLLAWRHGPERLSLTSATYALARFTACKAAFLARGFLAAHERYLLWGYGETGKSLRRALSALGKWPAAIVELHPRRLGQIIHGAPVIPPRELPAQPRLPLLVSVAGARARGEIRADLASMGFREADHFVCAA